MSRRVPQLLIALVALFGVVAVVISVRGGDDGPPAPDSSVGAAPTPTTEPEPPPPPELSPQEAADAAARAFLDTYVEPDGRVRRDPDGDTVSEGQAYAMLLAVATDDQATFDRVWTWTEDNLLGRNGTLAWKWLDGEVVDPNEATDADLDAGRALLLAAEAFDEPTYHADGLALGDALLTRDVVDTAAGPVLVAGPWALTQPHFINPSYMSDVAFEQFAVASGNPRWQQLAHTSNVLLRELTQNGSLLPSDWALVDPDGSVTPSAPPGGDIAAYGYDAFRTLPRLAEACDDESRQLAASLAAPAFRALEQPSGIAGLDGSAMTDGDNQFYQLGAAAAARAAGDDDLASELLRNADAANAQSPSYYLGAWVALTRVMLDTDVLGGCATTPAGESVSSAPTIVTPPTGP